MTVLSRREIQTLIEHKPPLVEGSLNLDQQLQPNGIDLTLRDVAMLQSAGRITVANDRRVISDLAPLVFDGTGAIDLVPGIYLITYNEIVNLPVDVMALARPRSSLLRCGVNIGTAVWDAGYCGRSQSSLMVYNPLGVRLEQNARVVQMVFFRLTGTTEGYQGSYQGENI
jgi:dUTP pyrophosphatase